MHNLTSEIAELYYQLVPPREEGLLIIQLHEKIKRGEIDVNFSIQDIQRAIEDTNAFTPGRQYNRERLLKDLLNYFIERPAEQKNRYCLTEYARKFILLLDHKINNPFRKFPLRESFKRYTDFSAQDIRQLNQFESWFNQGFQATTRENIFDHLEELKADVQASIQRLNKLLYSSEETVLRVVAEFSLIFTDLGDKADEIRDTLRLGNNLQLEVEKVVSGFYQQTTDFKPVRTPEETVAYDELHYAYTRSLDIQQEIQSFFDIVDSKLAQLRERIQFASTKLNELQDLFRYQSNFKLNLKRLLEYVLSVATPDKGEITLPPQFPRKGVVEEKFRLTMMPDLEREYAQRNAVLEIPEDPEYYQQEFIRVETELIRQQRTAILVDQYKARLETEGKLDFTEEFYQILDNEQDEEVAIQVGYELIQFAHENPRFQVNILPEILAIYQTKPIITWTINLNNRS
ncbi:MAG: hypothetical protein JWQ66_379 [Mucilaginibacter sp.]|nr:hypothetical protein [Mucilaginibacter sp.]